MQLMVLLRYLLLDLKNLVKIIDYKYPNESDACKVLDLIDCDSINSM